jgi:hypothetical protein
MGGMRKDPAVQNMEGSLYNERIIMTILMIFIVNV